jgi:FAD/FMN-containing dehydrogenase
MNDHVEGLSSQQLAGLRRSLNCPILTINDQEYDQARRVWNGMIDRRPSAIVRPTSIAEVMQTVRIAREDRILVSVRGGGHSVAGKSVAGGALMIDLSLMNSVQVNPAAQTAVAQGGTKWGAFDTEAERYQLATTGGVISSTGVCGLTLGGGIGWLMGKHGLSCDNVISADMVSADGSHLSVSATENEDLFWAIRGGGGNFGIVTALEFRLHPLKSVQAGLLLYPFSSAFDLLRRYRDVTVTAPDELTAYAALMTGHGNPMAAIAMCDSTSHRGSANVSSQFSLPNPPVADLTGEKKYTELQTMLDISAPAGMHYYFKCPFLRELSDEVLRAIVEHTASMPTEQTQVVLEHMHGAASRVPVSATAFGLRRTHYSINIMPAWTDPAMAEKCIDWAREFASAMEAFGASDAYVNYLGEEGASAVRASYGANYDRLANLKKKYDPDNFFQFNQNIPPAS